MKKKVLLILTLLIMSIAGVFGLIACVDDDNKKNDEYSTEGLFYKLENKEYTVEIYRGKDINVIIPKYYEGYPVTSIDSYAFSGNSSIVSVKIPKTIKKIDKKAFVNCDALTIYCEETKSDEWHYNWNFSNSPVVTYCNENDLANDGNIYYVADNGIRYALQDNTNKEATVIEQSTSITGAISIPNKITYKENEFLVKAIAKESFDNCDILASIEIPSSIRFIDEYAFRCSAVTIRCEVTVKPTSWDSDWNSSKRPVIWNCKKNDKAENGNIYFIAENGIQYALKDNQAVVVKQTIITAEEITIPSKITYKDADFLVTKITAEAFKKFDFLKKINIPNSVAIIGDSAFYECFQLESFVLPESLTSIAYKTFYGCRSIKILKIPISVTSIDAYAFHGFSCLEKIDYSGTKEDWKNIKKSSLWDDKSGDYTVSCSDGSLLKSEF